MLAGLRYSRSEALMRVMSENQLEDAVRTLRSIGIAPERIELEVEALPSAVDVTSDKWRRQLWRWARTSKLSWRDTNRNVTRRSRSYADFGIVKIRVLARRPRAAGTRSSAKSTGVKAQAAVGWRVGCFYSVAAIEAALANRRSISKPDVRPHVHACRPLGGCRPLLDLGCQCGKLNEAAAWVAG